MPLWGSRDDAANSDIAAVIQVRRGVTSANQSTLYGNVTANVFVTNQVVGQFGVDANEVRAANDAGRGHAPHAGWVLRHEGTGLKAGRVWYETLVAMGSMNTDGSDDTYMPDVNIKIRTQPVSSTSNVASNISFAVAATSVPTASISYQWQYNNVSGSDGWSNVVGTAGQYFNPTSATFTANNETANGNVFRVLVSATGANTVTSANATIRYIV